MKTALAYCHCGAQARQSSAAPWIPAQNTAGMTHTMCIPSYQQLSFLVALPSFHVFPSVFMKLLTLSVSAYCQNLLSNLPKNLRLSTNYSIFTSLPPFAG